MMVASQPAMLFATAIVAAFALGAGAIAVAGQFKKLAAQVADVQHHPGGPAGYIPNRITQLADGLLDAA